MNDIDVSQLDRRLLADLFRHQTDVLLHLLLHGIRFYLLAWQMGVGKTIVAVRLFWGLLLAGLTGALLYLCPASLKRQVEREIRRWGPPDLRIQTLWTRADRIDPTADVVICNYDLLLSDPLFAQLLAQQWLLLIIDESHLLRTPTAERTRRVLGRQPCLAGRADHVLALTGTPVVNSPLDLFPLINRLFPLAIAIKDANGERRMQRAEYEEIYCTKRIVHVGGGRTIETVSGGKNLADLRERLSPYISRLRRNQVLDLPPIQITDYALPVDTGDVLAAAMAAMPRGLAEALQSAEDDDLVHLLRQHAAELATLRRLIGTIKAPAAAAHMIERLNGGEDRVIAFHHHHTVGDIMMNQLRAANVAVAMVRGDTSACARMRAIDALNDGTVQVLLLQNEAGSLGLNLQSSRRVIVVEPTWTDATTQQSIGRVHRAGQTRDCIVEFLLIPNSLDEHIVGIAQRKAMIAKSLIETPVEETA